MTILDELADFARKRVEEAKKNISVYRTGIIYGSCGDIDKYVGR